MKHLFIAVALLFCANSAQSAPIGAVVQSTDYDAAKGVTTVHILNSSHKEISALSLSLRVTFPDGTVSAPGSSE